MTVELTKTPSFRLDGKRALVTGAGRGIGLSAASALADAGAHVTLAARTSKEIEEAAEAIRARGQKAEPLMLDVRDVETAKATIAAQAPFDILVNNAGTNKPAPFVDVKVEDFDFVFSLNVRAAYFVAQAVARKLIEAKRSGSIINMSSGVSSIKGLPNRYAYGATKAAVIGLTKAVAADFITKDIRCNAICPGTIVSPSFEERVQAVAKQSGTPLDQVRKNFIARQPMGRLGTVDDIMGILVFLASDESLFATGNAYSIDGGMTI